MDSQSLQTASSAHGQKCCPCSTKSLCKRCGCGVRATEGGIGCNTSCSSKKCQFKETASERRTDYVSSTVPYANESPRNTASQDTDRSPNDELLEMMRPFMALEDNLRETNRGHIQSMSDQECRDLLLKISAEHPVLVHPLVAGEDRVRGTQPPSQPHWCVCGFCEEMQNKCMSFCCNKTTCITMEPVFLYLITPCVVLIAGILNYATEHREDARFDFAAWRYRCYKFFACWQYGVLGQGRENRRCPPSCVVLRIHKKYPAPSRVYTGYKSFGEGADSELD